MQDENTTQPVAADDSPAADDIAASSEPELSLGSNPAQGTEQPPAETPVEPAPANDPPAYVSPSIDNASSDNTADSETEETGDTPASSSQPPGDLESIKSSALQELAPLVNELDQEPEDKYRTLMMLIQSSDNESLVKDAFDAAEKIEDKKAKAEALLSIVNEINYLADKAGKSEEV